MLFRYVEFALKRFVFVLLFSFVCCCALCCVLCLVIVSIGSVCFEEHLVCDLFRVSLILVSGCVCLIRFVSKYVSVLAPVYCLCCCLHCCLCC